MAFHPVKFYNNMMSGAPQLTNAFGSLTTMLDTILINGFNTKSVSSIVRVGTVVTVETTVAHNYQIDQIIFISGANESDYNGDQRVVSISTTSFTFETASTPATPATGTISVKVPGLQTSSNGYGWTTLFTGTNVRVYRTNNPNSKKPCLRVDNSQGAGWSANYAKFGKVTMAENYSDINTVVGLQAPYDPAIPTKNTQTTGSGTTAVSGWYKWYHGSRYYNSALAQAISNNHSHEGGAATAYTESTGNRSWSVVGDDRGFYLFIDDIGPANAVSGNSYGRAGYCFTDFNSFATNDACPSILVATDYYTTANATFGNNRVDIGNFFGMNLNTAGKVVMSEHHGVGATVPVSFVTIGTAASQMFTGLGTGVPSISGPDQSIILHPVYIHTTAGGGNVRGKMPGFMWSHNNSVTLLDNIVFDGVFGMEDKKFIAIGITNSASESNFNNMKVIFDITGPWY
jgi:hypothetical protein